MKESQVENTTTNCDLQEVVILLTKFTLQSIIGKLFTVHPSTKRAHADIFHISLLTVPELIFVTNITNYICGEKNCHVEKFQLSIQNLNNLWSFIEVNHTS